MESRAKLLGHPIHQMLVVFPIGLLSSSLAFDLLAFALSDGRFAECSFWMIAAGIGTGILAAIFGLVDWLAIPQRTRAKAIGALHALGNLFVLALFSIGLYLRWSLPSSPSVLALAISALGVLLTVVTGWLGGELVTRLGVGVDDNANLDAPSSLTHDSASRFRIDGMPRRGA